MSDSPLLALPGAVPAPTGVPAHFGDPSGEQWALEAGAALTDLTGLGVVRVAGPDRQTWLTAISSQALTGMRAGESRELLILEPRGAIQFACGVVEDGQAAWLLCEGAQAGALAAYLDSMRFRQRVEVADLSGRFAQFGAQHSEDAVASLPGWRFTWADPWPGPCPGGARYYAGEHPGAGLRARIHVVEAARAADFARAWLAAQPGRQAAGLDAWEATRVAAWRPRQAREVAEPASAPELDWLRTAVSLDKGCYRGQEAVARTVNLGRPARRLVFLQLDGSTGVLPRPGRPVLDGDRVVGRLTSVARHADQGPIALALVRRGLSPELDLVADGVAAAQEPIVPVSGKSDRSPAERPGAGLRGRRLGLSGR